MEISATIYFIRIASLFPREYFECETGKHYNYFRDYDSSVGRYLESDPIGLKGGLSTFAYVDGQPLKSFDELGLAENCRWRNMLVTAYCDKGPGKDWSLYAPTRRGGGARGVGQGTCAVANTNPKPYPFGCYLRITDDRGNMTAACSVHDTGAGWDRRHHNVSPDQWVDLWMPSCKDARGFGKQWLMVQVCCDDCNTKQ